GSGEAVTGAQGSAEIKWRVGSLALPLLPVSRLRLPRRTCYWLRLNAITMVGDFADFSEQDLLRIPCFSAKSLAVVKEALEFNGAKLRDTSYSHGSDGRGWREGFATWPTRALTGLACLLAGPRHGHLAGAWRADLRGDPQHEAPLPAWRRVQL